MPKKLTYEKVKHFIEIESKSGCKLKSNEYINNSEKLEIICPCGNIFYKRFNNFKSGKQRVCNKCAQKKNSESLKLNISNVKQFIEKDSNSKCILISTKYENKLGLLEIKCSCGEIFYTSWDCFKFSNKRRCDYCSGIKVRNKICPICNNSFKPVKKSQVCCSKRCANKLRNPDIFVKCDYCNEEFKILKSQLLRSKSHYCSLSCKRKGIGKFQKGKNNPNYKGKSYLGECSFCSKEIVITNYDKRRIKKNNYCSQECKAKHQKDILIGNNNPRYRSVECNCSFCGAVLYRTPTYIMSRKNIYCSQECKADWQSKNNCGENNPMYDKNISKEEREKRRNFDGYAY